MTTKPTNGDAPQLQLPVNLDDLPRIGIDASNLNTIAALALIIAQREARREGKLLDAFHQRAFDQRTSEERANMRAGVYRTLQALTILGWIERT
jgi:hypothetical protein